MRYPFIFLFFFYHLAIADEFNSLIEEYSSSNNISKVNIVIKDNIDIKGKATTAGSLALVNNTAKENAFLIEKLLANNFHIKGKSNLSEWANFRSTNSISGWSSINGQTDHPLDPEYNPCGSSSGSAVAVASGIVDIAIGTETNGSITCPASVVGIVGMKPTVGLVSRNGIIPIASSQDTAGPMGRSVMIVAQTLQAIAGEDLNDIKTKDIPQNFDRNFMDFKCFLMDFWWMFELILARFLIDFPLIVGQVSGRHFARFLINISKIFDLLARFLVDCSGR